MTLLILKDWGPIMAKDKLTVESSANIKWV